MVTRPSWSTPTTPAVTPAEHRLGEDPAPVVLFACRQDFIALGTQLLGHCVEGGAKIGEVPFPVLDRNLNMQIAMRNLFGSRHEAADGREPVRSEKPRPNQIATSRSIRATPM